MQQKTTSHKFTQLRRGLIEFALLTTINANEHKLYADSIRTRLESTEFAISKGTLYSALFKLRREKTIDHYYDESDLGPPRKYYCLTQKGKRLLAELNQYWAIINDAIKSLKE